MFLNLLDRASARSHFWEDLDRIHEEMTGNLFRTSGLNLQTKFPPVNIFTKENEAILSVILPGIDPEKIEILVEENRVSIHGKQEATKPEGNFETYRQETFAREFKRSFELPFRLDSQKSTAHYENGILTLHLQRDELDKPKKISISIQ